MPGASGSSPMPRKIAGSEISTIDELIVTMQHADASCWTARPTCSADGRRRIATCWSRWCPCSCHDFTLLMLTNHLRPLTRRDRQLGASRPRAARPAASLRARPPRTRGVGRTPSPARWTCGRRPRRSLRLARRPTPATASTRRSATPVPRSCGRTYIEISSTDSSSGTPLAIPTGVPPSNAITLNGTLVRRSRQCSSRSRAPCQSTRREPNASGDSSRASSRSSRQAGQSSAPTTLSSAIGPACLGGGRWASVRRGPGTPRSSFWPSYAVSGNALLEYLGGRPASWAVTAARPAIR